MSVASALRVEPMGESGGHCDCCGNETRSVWGYVRNGESPVACYFVQWTRNRPEHHPNFDFLIGTWGDDAVNDKRLVSWSYNSAGPGFMAIDSVDRPAAKSSLCSRALTREEVIVDGAEMELGTALIDAVWLGDPRIAEIREFGHDV